MTPAHPGVILDTKGHRAGSLLWARWETLAEKAPQRVVFPEPEDPRVLSAARYLLARRWAIPILVGSADRVAQAEKTWGIFVDGAPRWDPETDSRRDDFGAAFFSLRRSKGLTEDQARAGVLDPVIFATLGVRQGEADLFVGGAVRSTADTVRAGFSVLGLADGAETAFGAFLMECPHASGGTKTLLFADAAVSPHPSPRALASVGVHAGRLFETWTGEKARVAFVSFSTSGSAEDESVTAVRHAVELAHKKDSTLKIDGELQADAALVAWIARQKGVVSDEVAGRANVLIFPDLNAGNSAYKVLQHLGGARATGPLIAGLKRPFSDLSRGCNDEDIVNATLMTSSMA